MGSVCVFLDSDDCESQPGSAVDLVDIDTSVYRTVQLGREFRVPGGPAAGSYTHALYRRFWSVSVIY